MGLVDELPLPVAGSRINALEYALHDVAHHVAGEDYEGHTLPYGSAIRGTIHLVVNGREVEQTNKLPARFDVVDTARAQYELLSAIDRGDSYSGFPFCCVCGDRGCTYIQWEAEPGEDEDVILEMKDLGGREIGEFRYIVDVRTLRGTVLRLLEEVIEFMDEADVRHIEWAEWKDPPAGRPYYATRSELKEYAKDARHG